MCFSNLFCCRSRRLSQEIIQCPEEQMKILRETTSLKPTQINHLYKCFLNLGKDSYKYPPTHLKKRYFLSLPRLQRNPILTIILGSMFGEKLHLKFVDFATYLSNFEAYALSMKPQQKAAFKEKKLKLLFNMYDRDKNGIISDEDLIIIVHKLFAEMWSAEQIFKVVNQMMSEMDTSHTHKILYQDFCAAFSIFDMEDYLITRIPG